MKRSGSFRITVALAAGLVLAGCNTSGSSSGDADTDDVMLSANLSSAFEVPEVTVASDASGTAMVTFNRDSGSLSGSVTVEGLTGAVTGAHVHEGVAGVAGPVVVGLEQDNSNAMQWNIPAGTELSIEDRARLLNGELYFNVHTEANPAGEIRGQILAEGFSVHRFDLSGDNEVPPVETEASGVGYATINHLDQSVVIRANLANLSGGSAAHIHEGFAGANGGVLSNLEADFAEGFVETGSAVMLGSEDFESLINGGLYVNVHTGANPNGELRGQIAPMNIGIARAELRGNNEVPPVMTAAQGTGYVTFNKETGAAVMNVMTMGLSSPATMAHLHHAPAGENGGVVIGLEQDISDSSLWSETATLTSDQLELLMDGELYFNVHTGNFPNGEVRAQALVEGVQVARIELEGLNEVPPVNTTASGVGYATINMNEQSILLKVSVMDLADANAAHLHSGFAGANGGVVIGLDTEDNRFFETETAVLLNDTDFDMLLQGGHYLNVHSATHANGEVRGQVVPEGILLARTALSGDQEVPPVNPAGSGIGYTTVNSHTGSIVVNLMTKDLTSAADAAHIHEAPMGENGPVILGLEQNATDMDQWSAPADSMLDSDGLDAFFADNLYFNVHTGNNPSGEVRGQIEP